MAFYDELQRYDWDEVGCMIASTNEEQVQRALAKERCTLDDFAALISPAAAPYLRQMADRKSVV